MFLVAPLRSEETELWRVISDCWYFLWLILDSLQLPKANTGFSTLCSYNNFTFTLQFPPQAYEGHIIKSYHVKYIHISHACLFCYRDSHGNKAIGSTLSARISVLISSVKESNFLDR